MTTYTLLILILFLLIGNQQGVPTGSVSQEPRDQIQNLIDSLPSGSHLRYELSDGGHGDGTRFPWMDDMARQGVRRVFVEGHFVWRGAAKDISVVRLIYSSRYAAECAQITDPASLAQIRSSGLEETIRQVAIQRIARTAWSRVDFPSQIDGDHGVSYDELFDDERLPTHAPVFQNIDTHREPLVQAALLGDEFGMRQVVKVRASTLKREDLNSALFAASLGENSCVIRTLLSFGADVDARSKEGNTPLMNAVGSGYLNNVRVLLDAGADTNAKDQYGRSVLSAAIRSQHSEVVKLLRDRRVTD